MPNAVDNQLAALSDSLPDDLGIGTANIEDHKINALIYAMPGVGKTTLAESANRHPALAPALFLNMEGGLLSVARYRPNKIDITSVEHLETLLTLYAQGDPRLTRFRTLIVDSASELQRASLQSHIVGRQRGNRGRDLNDINRDDYGRMTVQLGRVLCMLRDLPVNAIITAHPTFVYPDGERGGEPERVFPAFTPRLATQVMGFYDFVWYMYMVVETNPETDQEEEVRYILTNKRGAYEAKTRGPRFRELIGSRFRNPTLPVLYDLLLQAESESPGDVSDSDEGPSPDWDAIIPNRAPVRPETIPFTEEDRQDVLSGRLTTSRASYERAEREEAEAQAQAQPEAQPEALRSDAPVESPQTVETPPETAPVSPQRLRMPVRRPTPTSRAMEAARAAAAQS